MKSRENAMTASGLNILFAIWLIFSPFVFGISGTTMAANFIIVGLIVGLIALIRMLTPQTSWWLSWINGIAGLWLILSPFMLGFTGAAVAWNSIIVGIVIAALSTWSANSSTHLVAG